MRCYITSSFGDSKEEIEKLCSIVKSAGFEDFSFIRDVENYQKVFDNPEDLMKRSEDEIKKSDVLLIDMTNKPTGRAIEAGMAYSLGKKIIAIMKSRTLMKDTTKGIADVVIEYDEIQDISNGLKEILRKWR
ncbi:nucleoside 2-deoxyribosyltransferase [candidate division WWE3 bacterium]|uniref:Nucleoside 2-deoxyribosyltransferase n=1 Tax=candidate division WWE3 bacterium TaxID=2053526 RepID=A0A928TQW8_UNCKA|nr:nucleoside 2-deoxyribosyltransferase [candidate division WWE3 bacterium]